VRELTDLELNILTILADNKGHALWEIAKLLQKEKSNLIIIMNRLEDEIELSDPLVMSYRDITDIENLEVKFHASKDPLSQYIKSKLKTYTLQLLNSKYPYSDFSSYASFDMNRILDDKILNDLNILLNDPCFFEEKRFRYIQLNEKIQEMIKSMPDGRDLRYLNRLLLQEGYPQEIEKCIDPIIYRGMPRKTTNPNSKQPKHFETPYFLTLNILVLEYIISNMPSIRSTTLLELDEQDEMKALQRQLECYQISKEEYFKAKEEFYERSNSKKYGEQREWMVNLSKELLMSQYVSEIIKKHGIKLIFYRIRRIGMTWDNFGAMAEKAIERGILSDEADMRFAELLIRYGLKWEESIRQTQQTKE
jgi:hypothetical protein